MRCALGRSISGAAFACAPRAEGSLVAAAAAARRWCSAPASTGAADGWEVVVGLELHVQVDSATKLFSGAGLVGTDKGARCRLAAPNAAGAPPNSNVALFDASHPGTLPALNWGCVEAAARTGFALGATVNPVSKFDRKHYFYADLPHGYQITQQDAPIVTGGSLPVRVDGAKEPLNVNIQRIQLEMDTGKSLHGEHPGYTLIDLNRAGAPLMEIVTEPDMRSGKEAAAFVKTFQQLLRHLNTSEAKLEDGNLRVDVNISTRRLADGKQSARCEIKNLNSTRSITRAIEYEASRQQGMEAEALERGESGRPETRTFDVVQGQTVLLRTKETGLDYRFMPEPDLPPLVIPEAVLDELKRTTPELPEVTAARLQHDHGLTRKQVDTLMGMPEGVAYFIAAVAAADNVTPQTVVKFLLGDLLKELKAINSGFQNFPSSASPDRVAELLMLVEAGTLSGRMAKPVVAAMVGGDTKPVGEIVKDECGGEQMTDETELREVCIAVLKEHAQQVEDYKGGKNRLMGLFVGQVMKRTGGRGDPKHVSVILQELIKA